MSNRVFRDSSEKSSSVKRGYLVGKVQERYSIAKEEPEHQVDLWSNDLKF